MRKWSLRVILLAALIGAGWWCWNRFFPSPEHVIRRRLGEVARTASFFPNEGPLAKAANSQKLANFCTTDVEIILDLPGHSETLSGQKDLFETALGARSLVDSLSVEFLDINIILGSDKSTAVANLTARAKVTGEKEYLVQELRFILKKIGRAWLINRIETVKTLS